MRRHSRSIILLLLLVAPSLGAQDTRNEREDPEAREEWFWAQRMFPFSDRPYAAMRRARELASNLPLSSRSAAPPFGGAWRALGPTGFFGPDGGFFTSAPQLDAGRIAAIAPSRVAGGPLFAGTASGGVWKSTNNGASWVALTDKECALTTGAVAVDPVNASIVYVGTGEYNSGSNGCGVLRSVDGGSSWTSNGSGLVSSGTSAKFGSMIVDRGSAGSTTSSIIIGATTSGIVRSANSGSTWSSVLTAGTAASVVAHPARAGTYWTGLQFAQGTRIGLWKSTDQGATWIQMPPMPIADLATVGRLELAVSAADPNKVWMVVNHRTTQKLAGLFMWDDIAQKWTQLAADGTYTGNSRGDFGAQSGYDLGIAVDPRDAKRIYVAGIRAFRSVDGGATFTSIGNEIHCDWHVIVIDPRNPDILYAGTDGGIFMSTDAGDTWTSRNGGLTIAQYYPGISVNPLGTAVMGGTQDNGTLFSNGSPYWDGLLSGDGGYTATNYRDPTIRWAEVQFGRPIVRRDGTGTRSRVVGIDTSDRVGFIPPLVMDPITPTKLYFGTFRLYRTIDDGLTWSAISGNLAKNTGTIFTIAVAPSDSMTIYVGTSDGNVQVSRDGGATFTLAISGLPVRTITRIVVDPATAAHALVTLSGFGSGHVFETIDAGVNWRNISGNLIDAPANSAVFIGAPGNIFVGTDVGVFQTADAGATWVAGPSGMPNVAVMDLIYSASANLLVAGTFGRGIFSYAPGGQAAVLRGDVNADGRVDALDALLIQEGLVGSPVFPSSTALFPRGDANCNGVIESADVVLILRAAVGLPNGTACVGTTR